MEMVNVIGSLFMLGAWAMVPSDGRSICSLLLVEIGTYLMFCN